MAALILHPASQLHVDHAMESLPHALIVSGKKGTGAASVAQLLSSHVGSPNLTIRPKKRAKGSSEFTEDIENGSIVIEDIRRLYEQTRSKFTSPQVFILDLGDRPMTQQAQNAFLKLLEEPVPNVHFIIATHHPELLLPTVVSRCEKIDLLPVTREQTEILLDQLGVHDATKRARIGFVASGLPAEITRLVADEKYYEAKVKIVQDAKAILEGKPYDRLVIIQAYKDDRNAALQLIDDMLMQLELSLRRSHNPANLKQIDRLVASYDAINQNGNIRLQLANALI